MFSIKNKTIQVGILTALVVVGFGLFSGASSALAAANTGSFTDDNGAVYQYQGQLTGDPTTQVYYSSTANQWYAVDTSTGVSGYQTTASPSITTDTGVVTSNGSTVPTPTPTNGSSGTPSTGAASFSNSCGTYTGLSVCDLTATIASFLITVSSFVMWLGAVLLNYTISYTITNLSLHLQGITAIPIAWTALRDLANIFFIFILLYIAIGTILQLNSVDTKKLLTHVIIVALLINFSLFFTQVIIDASNIFTLTFLNKITVNSQSLGTSSSDYSSNGLANAFAAPLGLGTMSGSPQSAGSASIGAFTKATYPQLFLIAVLSSVFLVILAFVFAVSSLFFIVRFITLIILMFLSPLAFAGMILPQTESLISKRWWTSLFNQALFAPVYFILMWVVVTIFSSFANQGNWENLFSGSSPSISILFNFAIIIGLTVSVLIVSKSFGAYGAAGALKALDGARKGTQGYLGRGTTRVLGINALEEKLNKTAFGNTGFGRGLRSITTQAAVGAKFGSGRSVVDVNKKLKENNKKYSETVEENHDKEYETTGRIALRDRNEAEIRALQNTVNTPGAPQRIAELRQQNITIGQRLANKASITDDEKNSQHYKDSLKAAADKLAGKGSGMFGGDQSKFRKFVLHSSAREAAAKHMNDKFRGKKTNAEQLLAQMQQQYGQPTTTPAPAPAPTTPRTP